MKKIISILLTSVLMMSICACGTDTQTEETTSTQTDYSDEIIEEVANTTSIEQTTTQPTETTFPYQVYSIDGMSSDEIYDLIISFSSNIHTGDTLDNYTDRFSVQPWLNESEMRYSFWSPENTTNSITGINVNAQLEMNNTITVNDDSSVSVRLALDDYDTASDLYSRLFDYLCQNTPNQMSESFDNREGTSWYSQVNCSVFEEEYNSNYCYSFEIRLEQNEMTGNYDLSVELPILVTADVES